jgi:hypothetical protein
VVIRMSKLLATQTAERPPRRNSVAGRLLMGSRARRCGRAKTVTSNVDDEDRPRRRSSLAESDRVPQAVSASDPTNIAPPAQTTVVRITSIP